MNDNTDKALGFALVFIPLALLAVAFLAMFL